MPGSDLRSTAQLNSLKIWLATLAALAWTTSVTGKNEPFGVTPVSAVETYRSVPMPPGIQVVVSPLEGPVFADRQGKTLYTWPILAMRQGYTGDPKDKSVCEDKITTETGGFASPYPAGLSLPEIEKRKSCKALWAPVSADKNAKPVGDFSIVVRSDGSKQWAFDHHALYTSYLDRRSGDVLGETNIYPTDLDTPAERIPATPPADVPPEFRVVSTVRGRQLLTEKWMSVYASDQDSAEKSNCDAACEVLWHPMIAPGSAQPHGDFTILTRAPAVRQWAFRHRPLYTYARDEVQGSVDGSEEPGWHNVYAQLSPAAPNIFTVQVTINGDVLADSNGMTVYFYRCGDDSSDQLACDTPDGPQAYRLAICGAGDVERCNREWRYVPAAAGAKSSNTIWSILTIDPRSGHEAKSTDAGAQRVWAYRGRPVYTYAGDLKPGDYNGDALGEWHGWRNGFRAFWIVSEWFGRS
jgi:predicted lipoprotein with Yx(FWY)xxD motif